MLRRSLLVCEIYFLLRCNVRESGCDDDLMNRSLTRARVDLYDTSFVDPHACTWSFVRVFRQHFPTGFSWNAHRCDFSPLLVFLLYFLLLLSFFIHLVRLYFLLAFADTRKLKAKKKNHLHKNKRTNRLLNFSLLHFFVDKQTLHKIKNSQLDNC